MLRRGCLGSVLVLVGGTLFSTLPRSTELLTWRSFATWRASTPVFLAGYLVCFVGLVVLSLEWLRLIRTVRADARKPSTGSGTGSGGVSGGDERARVALVRRASALWSAPLLIAPPLFSKDGWAYAAQGMLVRRGLSPYVDGPGVLRGPIREAVDPRWWHTPTPYGPLTLWFGSLGAGLTGNPWVLVLGHRLLAVLGLALLAWAVPRLARWSGLDAGVAAAAVLASPLMLGVGVGGLHNDLLMAGLMACALVVAGRSTSLGARAWLAAAVIAGLAASIKAPAVVIVVPIALVSLPRETPLVGRVLRLAAAGALAAATVVALGVLTGLGLGWTHALGVPGSVATPLSVTTDLGSWLGRVAALHLLGSAASLAAIVFLALRRPTGDHAGAVRLAALVLALVLALSPVVQVWYLLWLVPFLAVVAMTRLARVALVAAIVAFAVSAPIEGTMAEAYRILALLGLGAVVVIALLARCAPRAESSLRRLTDAEWLPVG